MIEIISSWALGGIAGGVTGFWIGHWWPRRHRPRRPGPYISSARGFAPPPTALGTRRVYYDMPAIITECGGPCASCGPAYCDCGQLWRDVQLDEGRVQRGNGNGGPSTPKPEIIAKPQLPGGRLIIQSALPRWRPDGYQPRPHGGTPNPPPKSP